MKIERIRVDAFGRLAGYETGTEPLPGLVVVLGPNEAGKSTLFHCLTTLLYGFRPASREAHPYVPWGGPDLAAGAAFRLDAGGCVEVERRLLSQPSGRMTLDGRVEDLRNRPLPWTEHVPVQVFRQVFALTLTDLAELDGEAWARVQDRIVGSMGASDVASARQVAAELEREAGELWRPNRRGNQRVRDIEGEVRALRARRRQAMDRDTELRGLVHERDEGRAQLRTMRETRERGRLAVDRVQELLPVRRQLQRIRALREQAGPTDTLADLPRDPAHGLEELERSREVLMTRRAELDDEAKEPARLLAAYGAVEGDLVSRAEVISGFAGRAAGAPYEQARARGLEQEITDLERRLETECERTLSVRWPEVSAGRLTTLPTHEIRGAVQAFSDRDDQLRILREAERLRGAAGSRPVPPALLVLAAAVAISGGILLVLGLHEDASPLAFAGILLAFAGLGLLGALWRLRTRRAKATDGRGIPAAAEARERARVRVLESLGDLPLAPGFLETPSMALVAGLESLQAMARAREERVRTLEAVRERLGALDAEARRLLAATALDTEQDAATAAHVLQRELTRAERARDAAAAATRESERITRERRRLEQELEGVEAERGDLVRRLAELGDGSVERGTIEAGERLKALRRADELQDELERAHPSLGELVTRIAEAERAGESWTMDDEDLVRRRARVEELTEDIEALATRAEALDRDIAHLRDVETVDAVDGEIASLEEERARLTFERDRRWVLAALLREADRRFRDEHQPDLIRRAGAYLAHLTGGRYDRIVADETAEGSVFLVYGPTLPGPVPLAHPVSTGTLEQAYLSLRLAIVDHLDQGGERLPLFVDEVFVNWDDMRRARGMDELVRIADKRQLFVFTCHDEIAADLEARGARILNLADG